MNDNLQARPGQHYLSALLTFTCLDGFGLLNDTNRIFCYNGIWSSEFPNCVRKFTFYYKKLKIREVTGTFGLI